MKLPDSLSVDDLEAEYSKWWAVPESSLSLPVTLPQPLPFCVEGLLLQFIASMSRRLDHTLSVRFKGLSKQSDSYETSLQNALGSPHSLCAWIMSAQAQDEHGTALPKSDSRAFAAYLDAMDSYDFLQTHATTQSRVNLVCVQGAAREYIRALYHKDDSKHVVKPYPDIRLLVQDILSLLAPTWTGKNLREVAAPTAQLVKELMENADWWARTDENGIPYLKGKSFRVLNFRLVDIDEDNAETFGGMNQHVQNYLQTTLLDHGTFDRGDSSSRGLAMKKHSFVELSVVDSGPGLVRRWLSSLESGKKIIRDLNDISYTEEENVIADCFKKWATSSHNSLRGIGLFSVARMLREKNGFLRLRTGRLSYLFGTKSAITDVEAKTKGKAAATGPDYVKLDDGTHVFFEDGSMIFFLRPWIKDQLSPVEGTSYSILLPV